MFNEINRCLTAAVFIFTGNCSFPVKQKIITPADLALGQNGEGASESGEGASESGAGVRWTPLRLTAEAPTEPGSETFCAACAAAQPLSCEIFSFRLFNG